MKKNKGQYRKVAGPAKKSIKKDDFAGPLQRLENFLSRNQKPLIFLTLLLSLLLALFLFDIKISEGNDDSMYIEGGFSFSRDFTGFYTANAPLYPMFLSIFIKFFGVKLILLKFISLACSIFNLYLFYLIFRNRIPYSVLIPVIFITGINSYYLYFASQTYTEAFFSLLQTIFIASVFKLYDSINDQNYFSVWKQWVLFGLSFLLLTLCKNIAIACIPAIVLFFLIDKKIKAIVFALLFMGVFRIGYDIVQRLTWDRSNQFVNQSTILLQKDPYNADKGQEDVSGFINRFFGNVDLYISKRFFQILGFKSPDSVNVNSAQSFLVVLLLILAFIVIVRRKNKYLLFTGFYAVIMSGLTFLVLQTRWDQPRYFLVYAHLIILLLLFGAYAWLEKKSSMSQRLYLVIILVLISSGLIATLKKGAKNLPALKKNIAGDIYYGFTPDYINYLKLSKWCADSLPTESYVATRKAPMSFIYSEGKEFFPVYSASSTDPDTVLSIFKNNKVTHVILANLRRDPKKNDGLIINTLQRMIQPVAAKYPRKLKFVKRVGESEPAELYEIIY